MSDFPHKKKTRQLASGVYLAPGAHVVGDVAIGEGSSLWFNTVARGDVNSIRIGCRTNIQDLCMVHVSGNHPTVIGDDVTVGHGAILHACTIGNQVLIGMGSIVLDGAEIGDQVLLGAGSLVTPGTRIPSGKKAFGRPAKVVGDLTESEIEKIKASSTRYVLLAAEYRAE